MGEYAKYRGESVKIGTCEDMYYLRHGQRKVVTRERGNVDPVADVTALRFRFPFPDEDHIEPGHFETYGRHVAVPSGWRPADGTFDHDNVQFTSRVGYLLSIPCPESGRVPDGVRVHKNGWHGDFLLVQQKQLADGRLVPVLQCGGCGAKFRLEDAGDIDALRAAFRSYGDAMVRQSRDQSSGVGKFWHAIADRI